MEVLSSHHGYEPLAGEEEETYRLAIKGKKKSGPWRTERGKCGIPVGPASKEEPGSEGEETESQYDSPGGKTKSVLCVVSYLHNAKQSVLAWD